MTHVETFKYEGASVKLTVWDEHKATLSDLWSQHIKRGHATRVMEMALSYADAKQLTVLLCVQQYRHHDPQALTNAELALFYGRFGFRRHEESVKPLFMLRSPSQELHGS